MGHLGLLPQSETGPFKFKGKLSREKNRIIKEAKLLEKAGVFSIVLECVESTLAKKITEIIAIPTIGIGASVNCDGQVLVTDDLIGLNSISARFVKKYVDLKKIINKAALAYKKDVKNKKFPTIKHSY
jgi:3-methyl-2-oxobutanoate hydroxymethyltransferase